MLERGIATVQVSGVAWRMSAPDELTVGGRVRVLRSVFVRRDVLRVLRCAGFSVGPWMSAVTPLLRLSFTVRSPFILLSNSGVCVNVCRF